MPLTNRRALGGFGGGNTTSAFGQNKPAFGTTTTAGNSLFGGSTATTGSAFGGGSGFGQTGGAFGSGSNTGTAFGQSNKPTFGQAGGLFPGGGGGFGQTTGATSTPGNAFGASGSSPFGGAQTNNGTGSIPFTAHTDKEGAGTNQSNAYQTITAMPAYAKWCTEELRTVDYAQGRKYGNQNGQGGAFGVGTGFGGFGDSKPTGFGTSNTTTGFGGAQNTTSSFGNTNSGGGLFGPAKPATSGIFGAPAASSAPSTGGLFGSTGTGFGSGNNTGFGTTSTNTGFGQTQNKPAFGGFGTSAATTGTATGGGLFGQPAATGNAFGGGATAGNAFGATQSSTGGGGFSFGQQNQPQQSQTGGAFGAFGANNQPQQKPGGLFGGGASTGGGLFGGQQPQQQQTGGGLFGSNASTQQQGGGLFGSKPATTGGLFGNSTNSGTGGLFSNQQQQQQQPQTGGLFGASNTQQNSGGLFGNRAPAASTGLGGSLFGQNTSQQQPAGSGLFGASQQQQQQPALGNSLFSSLNQQTPQNQQNQPNYLYATLNDNPYNNVQLFAELQTPTPNFGPLATPLTSSQSTRKQAVIPHYRMAPSASSRLITPQKRSGYGFSYSTYSSPNSAISNASPMGFGNSLLSGSMGRSMGKSLSTSNLRHAYTAQDSILAPGAFSGATRNGTGSMKKLNINRGLSARHSLFGTEVPAGSSSALAKKVSFENGLNSNGVATVRPELSGATGSSRTTRSSGHDQSRASERTASTESTQANGSNGKDMELAIVPENDAAITVKDPYADQIQGEYWMQPNVDQLKAMSREQRANLIDFKVGRYGCGSIVFHKVDLTNTPIEQIAGGIVVFITRQATVYPRGSPQKKPAVGSGLNVPSTITLDNSWARSKRGRGPATEQNAKVLKRHVESLQKDQRTKFVAFDAATGQWTFRVEHYTTYGLVYDDNADDDDDDDSIMASTLPDATETATPVQEEVVSISVKPTPSSVLSSPEASIDDTFDFKKARGQAKNPVPGQFEDEGFEEDEVMDSSVEEVEMLDDQSQGSGEVEDVSEVRHENGALDYDMAGSFPLPTGSAVQQDFEVPAAVSGPVKPKSILKDASVLKQGTPSKADPLVLVHDWTEQLQYTASPRKRDRAALRDNQTAVQPAQKNGQDNDLYDNNSTNAFGTNLDIMKSLFAASDGKKATKVPEVRS
jgi:nuclear pore complex protein Nup98-Nup96